MHPLKRFNQAYCFSFVDDREQRSHLKERKQQQQPQQMVMNNINKKRKDVSKSYLKIITNSSISLTVICRRERMSNDDFSSRRPPFRRRTIRPLNDRDDNEDELRRDVNGRKRVDVIECLLESSSDEDSSFSRHPYAKSNSILWLTLTELMHIRSIIAQTSRPNRRTSTWKLFQDQFCFRCGKQLNTSMFVPSFLSSSVCSICQQKICQTCSISNYPLPSSLTMIPVRLNDLLKTASSSLSSFDSIKIPLNQSNSQSKTICYDCAQIFSLYTNSLTRRKSARNRHLPTLPLRSINSNHPTRHSPSMTRL